MSLESRITKLEAKAPAGMTVEVTYCNGGETAAQAIDRLGIIDVENVHRIFVSFG